MLRRGCSLLVLLFGALFALYFWLLHPLLRMARQSLRRRARLGVRGDGAGGNRQPAVGVARHGGVPARGAQAPLADGTLVVAAGPIRPLGAPLTSPFSGQPCVAYEYEVVQRGPARSGETSSPGADIAGFAMAASAIDTSGASVRLLGFPILDQFPQSRDSGPDVAARARQYAASAPFETMRGLGKLQMFASFDDALADADGAVRKDFRLTDEAIPFERRTLGERIVRVGEEVCALGRYDAEKRALVPSGATLNRLWPGTPAKVRRTIVATARSQAVLGFTFFAVSHAMLGAAFYMSETRYAREPEDRQASAIRSAIQDNDVAALERVVRQGASPNARDTFGDAVLLDVREPAMAAALVRLGANVNVRHRDDADTPLIRAARMGNVELVRILLAAHADVHARMSDGATALSEAIRGGQQDVIPLLRAAGADAPDVPVER